MAVEEKGGGKGGGGREGEGRRKPNTEAMWMWGERGGRRRWECASERFCLPTKAKTASLNYKINLIFVDRNWYKTDTRKLVADDLAPRQNYEFILRG